jgi:hypothetical protein
LEIEKAMTEVLDEHEKRTILKLEPGGEGKNNQSEREGSEMEGESGEDEESAASEEEGTISHSSHETLDSLSLGEL